MPPALKVPWEKIRASVENGLPMKEAAKAFEIGYATIRQRSNRESWKTPKRLGDKLKRAERAHRVKVAGVQGHRDEDQTESLGLSSVATSTATNLETLAKDYRNKAAEKLYRAISGTIIAPPRTWKDFDTADRMMRRTLGMDENEGKTNTIVQLQVVNERLRVDPENEIIEGEYVPNPSPNEGEQSKHTDSKSEEVTIQTTPSTSL